MILLAIKNASNLIKGTISKEKPWKPQRDGWSEVIKKIDEKLKSIRAQKLKLIAKLKKSRESSQPSSEPGPSSSS